MKFKQFVVIGTGEFPLDMLRYDACWPATSADADMIREHGQREISLELISSFEVTAPRWESFGWKVKP